MHGRCPAANMRGSGYWKLKMTALVLAPTGPHQAKKLIDDRRCLAAGMQVISLIVTIPPRALSGVCSCKVVTVQGDQSRRADWLSIFPRSMFNPCSLRVVIQSRASRMVGSNCTQNARRRGEKPVKGGGMSSGTMASHAGDSPPACHSPTCGTHFNQTAGSAVAEFERVCRC
jgi:hypothetical protein